MAKSSYFLSEIEQQPEILERIIGDESIRQAAGELKRRSPPVILTLARGSSDNAVTFFSYLAGRYLGLPVASVPPSVLTVYTSTLSAASAVAIGVSQSGESSDVVEGLRHLRAAGAVTVAVCNAADSSLGRASDHQLLQHAGPEQAVAASKTFSSQMMVLAALVARWADDAELWQALARVPDLIRDLLGRQGDIERAALRLTHAGVGYVLGRGFSYGPALELALKLKETSYLHAHAYSSAEFQHGPIASVDPNDPIIILGNDDESLPSNVQAAERLAELGADLTIVSGSSELLAFANARVELPSGLHPASEAFLQVAAGQLLAYHLATSRGLDPDRPRHLSKVTKTM